MYSGFGTTWQSSEHVIGSVNQIHYLWVQVFADVLFQEGTSEDRADRGTVTGVNLKNVCVRNESEKSKKTPNFYNYFIIQSCFYHLKIIDQIH